MISAVARKPDVHEYLSISKMADIPAVKKVFRISCSYPSLGGEAQLLKEKEVFKSGIQKKMQKTNAA